MPRFIAFMAMAAKEALETAGFTGVTLTPAAFTRNTISWILGNREGDQPDPFELSKKIGYHRVTTDQGTFGVWFLPAPMIDIDGTGIKPIELWQAGSQVAHWPLSWGIVEFNDGVPERLFLALTKRKSQP